MPKFTHDAIVVGAGPGGASAAFYLAATGARTLLLERETLPRTKACGDGVAAEGIKLALTMGLDPARAARWWRPEELVLTSPRGKQARCRGASDPDAAYSSVVPRAEFDHALAMLAVTRGAELREGSSVAGVMVEDGAVRGVRVDSASGPFEATAPLVIAADGFDSSVGRALGIRHASKHTARAIRAYYRLPRAPERAIEIHMHDSVRPGYGWYFPCGEDVVNVGVGILESELAKTNETAPRAIEALFERFLRENPFVARRLAGATRISELHGGPIAMMGAPTCTVRPGCLFVGDAAGFTFASTGEGVALAMGTGKLAGEVGGLALDRGAFDAKTLGEYDRRWKQRYAGALKASKDVQNSLAQKNRVTDWVLERIVEKADRDAKFGTYLVDLVSGPGAKGALGLEAAARILF
jgi:geranylgeranyl reductase family protein